MARKYLVQTQQVIISNHYVEATSKEMAEAEVVNNPQEVDTIVVDQGNVEIQTVMLISDEEYFGFKELSIE